MKPSTVEGSWGYLFRGGRGGGVWCLRKRGGKLRQSRHRQVLDQSCCTRLAARMLRGANAGQQHRRQLSSPRIAFSKQQELLHDKGAAV
jgi:hypothetical protein